MQDSGAGLSRAGGYVEPNGTFTCSEEEAAELERLGFATRVSGAEEGSGKPRVSNSDRVYEAAVSEPPDRSEEREADREREEREREAERKAEVRSEVEGYTRRELTGFAQERGIEFSEKSSKRELLKVVLDAIDSGEVKGL